jgi:hypothetical protein
VLKNLKAADIAAIAIREGGAALTLELKTVNGASPSAAFPADADKVRTSW